jgi:manganese peroxidase
VTCPLGPTVQTYVGRQDRSTPNPEGLLPDPHTSADTLIANMEAKGFSAADIGAILGAHSSAKQFEFDPSQAGAPLDDTPGIWDVVCTSKSAPDECPLILA